ncbi:MAG: SLC13 family permease [Bacteroidota bacterium]
MNKLSKIIICTGIPLAVLMIPTSFLPFEGITIVEHRVIAIFLFAALAWILEPIPIHSTSLMIILLELILVSDKGLKVLIKEDDEVFGEVLSYGPILKTFASPIIILFLGGFFLAMAATKYRLDQNLAKVLLKPFGARPSSVMLGIMIITALFSMFMSNTATTAMMLSILTPVLLLFDDGDKGKIAFTLAVPVAANIGGIGTPIGTPPNAVALKYLTGENAISFSSWMSFGVPYVIIMLLVGWLLLKFIYPISTTRIDLNIKSTWQKSPKARIVYITFAGTVLLWLTGNIHGMNSYVVAMVPVAVFSVCQVITKEDLKKLSWDVLWLVSGGIALGYGLETTGLAARIISSIPFDTYSPAIIILAVSVLAAAMANFMSNTATANLLLPLMAALGMSLSSLSEFGGQQMIIVAVTISCSMGMALPISTPPNALAFASGLFETKHMAKPGVMIAIVGLLLNYCLIAILNLVGFFQT